MEDLSKSEVVQLQNQSFKTEASGVDFIKLGYNPAVLIFIICLLLYLLGRAHGRNTRNL